MNQMPGVREGYELYKAMVTAALFVSEGNDQEVLQGLVDDLLEGDRQRAVAAIGALLGVVAGAVRTSAEARGETVEECWRSYIASDGIL